MMFSLVQYSTCLWSEKVCVSLVCHVAGYSLGKFHSHMHDSDGTISVSWVQYLPNNLIFICMLIVLSSGRWPAELCGKIQK